MSTLTSTSADDLARMQMAITKQTEAVQAVFESGKPAKGRRGRPAKQQDEAS